MTKRKGIRLLAALALCFTLCISFTVPAFAYADDTEPVSYTHLDVYKRQRLA